MAKITMELIKELREKTQVGMMDCKKALQEADGDIDKAIELLRKKGAAVAQKRAGNETNNGHIESCLSPDNKKGVLLKVSCETDFSANTEDMKNFSQEICKHILNKETKDIESLLNESLFENEKITVQQRLEELISRIAESIKTEKFVYLKTNENGLINSYIHPGANLGVIIELIADKTIDEKNKNRVKELAHDICMQIAVTNPLSIRPEELDKSLLRKEQEVIREQLISSGKPENMIDKIMQGKLKKYYEEVCLENQRFIKDDKKTISQIINEVSKETDLNIKIKQFARFTVGK
ncbi:elongation factor Ts [Candidatus Dependentiae bacterium]|nr:elongation factor Ts [Candidatus Dependentiae bacterium]